MVRVSDVRVLERSRYPGDETPVSENHSIDAFLLSRSPTLNRWFWLDVMEHPDIHSLVDVQRTLQTTANALDAILPIVTPLHEEIFKSELTDLIGPMNVCGRTEWQADFETAYIQLAKAVDSYSEFVEDAVGGMTPFLELS